MKLTENILRRIIREELLREVSRDDPRYVDSDSPRAKLVAWGGESERNANLDMGGWTERGNVDEFVQAIQNGARLFMGEPLNYIEIVDKGSGGIVDKIRKV